MKKITKLFTAFLLVVLTSVFVLALSKSADALTVVTDSLWETDGSGYYGLSETNSNDASRTNRIATMSNPYVTSSSYTMSAHFWSGSTTAGETVSGKEVQMGLVPYYVDDNNFLAVYMEWKNTTSSNKMAAVTIHFRDNGTDKWTNSWVHDSTARASIALASNYGKTTSSDSAGFDLSVTVTSTTIKVTCGSCVMEYESYSSSWTTTLNVTDVKDGDAKYSFSKTLCGSGVTAKSGIMAYNCQANVNNLKFTDGSGSTSTPTGSGWTASNGVYTNSGSIGAGSNAFYILQNSHVQISSTYSMSAKFKSSSATAGETVSGAEVKMGLVPYYVDESNFVNVFMEWKNETSSSKMAGVTIQIRKNGTDAWMTYWVHDWSTRQDIAKPSNSMEYTMVVEMTATTVEVSVNGITMDSDATGSWTSQYDVSAYFNNMTGASAPSTSGLFTYNCNATVSNVVFDSQQYKLVYNANGGTGSVSSRNCGITETFNLADNTFTRTGYTPNDWNTAADGSGTTYASGAEASRLSDGVEDVTVTLYAQWTPNPYKVQFNANGGIGEAEDQSFKYDAEQELTLNTATRASYTFAGWNTKEDGSGTSYADGAKVKNLTATANATVVLYAQWVKTEYNVKFDANEGTVTTPIANQKYTVADGGSLPLFNNAYSRVGYTFAGWNTIADGSGTFYADGQTLVGAITSEHGATVTLYAQWDPISYSVKFDGNGNDSGSTNPIDTVYGENITIPGCGFKRTGYEFSEWNTSADGTGTKYSKDDVVNNLTTTEGATITLYAQWKVMSYKITLYDGSNKIGENSVDYGATVTLPTADAKEGYTFAGWYENQDLSGEEYVASVMPAKNFNLFAKYTPNEYTIEFDGYESLNITAPYGSSVSAPENPTKAQHVFVGWYSNQELTTPYTFDTMPLDGIKLYAKWELSAYTIVFDGNGGTGMMDNQIVPFGSTIALPENKFEMEGYRFAGWNTIADGSGVSYNDKHEVKDLDDCTLYAQWLPNEYTIEFDGYESLNITLDYQSAVTKPQDPTKEGYTFAGWYTNEAFSGTAYVFSTMPLNGVRLYAKWTANQYTIEFDGYESLNITKGYESSVTAPVNPTKEGHTFAGWYLNSECSGDAYEFSTMPLNGVKLYAKWTANQYTITFDGYESLNITLDYQSELIEPTAPTKDGYTFAGWYSDRALTNEFDFATEVMPLNGIKLFAKWTVNQYTIVFDDYESLNITADYQSAVSKPVNPTKDGYQFAGWYTEEALTNAYTFTTMPLNGVTLYAKWTANTYVIRFYRNGSGSGNMDELSATVGTTFTLPTCQFTWKNHEFLGWATSEDGSVVYNDGASISEALTLQNGAIVKLYAVWKEVAETPVTYTVTFKNYDGTVLEEVTVNAGSAAQYTGATPEKAADSEYRYEFDGWDVEFDNVNSDLIVTAKFKQIPLGSDTPTDTPTEDNPTEDVPTEEEKPNPYDPSIEKEQPETNVGQTILTVVLSVIGAGGLGAAALFIIKRKLF